MEHSSKQADLLGQQPAGALAGSKSIEDAKACGQQITTGDTGRKTAQTRVGKSAILAAKHGGDLYTVFTDRSYSGAYSQDLKNARGQIIIITPYATTTGVEKRLELLRSACKRGVHVCTFLCVPKNWEHRNDTSALAGYARDRLRGFIEAVEMLKNVGVHVTLRENMHEKLTVIDDTIMWDGSLNYFSHYGTSERLTRWTGRIQTIKAIELHDLHCPLAKEDPMRVNCIFSIAKQIAKWRQASGITQDQLASSLSTNQTLVSDFELGRRNIKCDTLEAMCAAINLDLVLCPRHMTDKVRLLLDGKLPKS